MTATLLTEWARLLLDGFAQAGVTDVVASPGSRSTPFVLAARAHPRLSLRMIVDERDAAFFALGLARATGRPPLGLCTSGSAGAHWFPAFVEASAAHLPLVLLTADRPFELQGCAAPQTVDQLDLFGRHARRFFELGLPDPSPPSLRALRRAAFQAVAAARWPEPGPVQVNARARLPLEPRAPADDEERALAAVVDAIAGEPPPLAHPPRALPSEAALEAMARACAVERGLIVCGPAPLADAAARRDLYALAERSGFPLCAEATSQQRFVGEARPLACDGFDLLLRSRRFLDEAAPELVLQFGAPPTSRAFARFVDERRPRRFAIAPHGWNDPHASAEIVAAPIGATAHALAERLPRRGPGRWAARVAGAEAAARRAVDALAAGAGFGEAEVARAAVRAARGGLLAVGNSLPVRDLDAYCPGALADCGVLAQRGANGIDGLVAGAAAAASTGTPTTLLLGDVSLQHDLGGLAVAAGTALTIVVVHNGGGRIFEQLPVAAAVDDAALDEAFVTKTERSFQSAAAHFGIAWFAAEEAAALAAALGEARASGRAALVEARVPPHGAAALAKRIAEVLA